MRVALAGLLLIVGCGLVDNAVRRPAELMDEATAAQKSTSRNGLFARTSTMILRSRRLVISLCPNSGISMLWCSHARSSQTSSPDLLSLIRSKSALSHPTGCAQSANVHSYGRLGLATPTNRADAEIFWVIIAKSSE